MLFVQVLAALQLVLRQIHDSKEQLTLLCTLLKVNKAVRRAAQRSGVQCSINVCVEDGSTAANFAAWLTQHAGLIGHLAAACGHQRAHGVFEQFFAMALQLYKQCRPAAAPDSPSSASTFFGPSTATVRLSSLWLRNMNFPRILQAIQPADSLTSLILTERCTGAVLAGLSTLKSLQQLELLDQGSERDHEREYEAQQGLVHPELYHAVAGMSHLTSLTVTHTQVSQQTLQKLPCSLRFLTLHGEFWIKPPASPQGGFSLQHLSDLQELAWCWPKQDSAVELAVPQQVTSVVLAGCVHADLPPSVVNANIVTPEGCMPVVEQLPALQGLQRLSLGFGESNWERSELRAPQIQQVSSVLGSLQQLTSLHVNCMCWGERTARPGWGRRNQGFSDEVQLGTSLQQLHMLKHLHLQQARMGEADAMLLSGLTSLTYLGLPHAGAGVTDFVVGALALKLTGLVVLNVRGCGLRCTALLPVVGRLTGLHRLNLDSNDDLVVDEMGLFALTSLRQLTALTIPSQGSVSSEAVELFLAAMPCLGEVEHWAGNDVF